MKKVILRLLPWLITLALIAAVVIFIGIPLYGTPDEELTLAEPVVEYYEGDNKPLVMENEAIRFEMDPTTTQFTVTDKATGKVWYSNPADAADDPVALAANKENLFATLMVSYTNASGTASFNNYKYAAMNGTYTIDVQEDGSIRVNYAVGQIEKIYRIPTAITKERYVAFTDAMKKSTKKKVQSNYTLYEPEKLDTKKNKDEIIAMYPSVVDQPLYILKDGTSEANKAKIESYFAEVNYSEEDFAIDQALVAVKADNNGAVFNVSMVFRLEGSDLVVEVPYDSIRYKADYPITELSILPMFGAAGTADEGYMFIPEGGGALIRFNNGKLNQNAYYANMYGWDYGVIRQEMVSETRINFPVFGMVRDDGSFLCMLEGPTSFAGIQADISGRYNSYNTVSAKYHVLHADRYNVSAKTANLVYMFEKEIPDVTIRQRYRFFGSGDYVELANAYGDYLCEQYPEMAADSASEDMPVSVELVGAIDKTVVKFGLPIDSVFATTTFKQGEEIIRDMLAKGTKNLSVRYSGWANGGVTQQVLNKVKTLRELGGDKDMKALIAAAKELDVSLYFDGVTTFAYDSGILEGFIPFSDASRHTTREQIVLQPYNIVTYQQTDWMDEYYVVKPALAKQYTTNLINALAQAQANGVAFRDIGSILSADYNPKDTTTREQVKAMNVASMQEAQAAGQKVMIKQGNDYALPYADMITDMPTVGTKYSLIDETVPFYQIALHGMKDYTGLPINLSNDYQDVFLQCVEYGSGLNFTFMAENGKVLQDTLHTGYYGANYTAWADDAAKMITDYQASMAGLNKQAITAHERLTADVAVTTYADGTKVYVNYGTQDYAAGSVNVPARGYTVERGNAQ